MIKKTEFDKVLGFEDMPREEVVKRAADVPMKEPKQEIIPHSEGEAHLTIFKGTEIRRVFHNNEWWHSVIDVVGSLSQSKDPSRYWSELKKKLSEESGGSELFDKIEQLKMPGKDGKMYLTDCANTETILRIIQSIPSPNAEPFKRWLAKTAYERILEFQNPEIAVKRAILNWQIQGRDDDWIEARLRSIVVRNELTSEWQKRGIEKGWQYGFLTNVISKETFNVDTDGHKEIKSLSDSHSLRDHMTDLELVFTMLGEKSTAAIAQATDAVGFGLNIAAATAGGKVAGDARKGLEEKLQKSVVSSSNFLKSSRVKDPEQLTAKKEEKESQAE